MQKDSFVFRSEWLDAIQPLPPEVRAEVCEAIIVYGITNMVSNTLSPISSAVFNLIKTKIDYDSDIRAKRSAAGKKGGAPKGNTNAKKQAKQANLSKKQAKTNNACLEDIPPIPPIEDNKEDSNESLSTSVDPKSKTPSCEEVVDFYNKTVKGTALSSCKKLTDDRKKAIKARIRQYGVECVYEAITIAASSQFCNGANDRNWTADFDFVFNANKMAKILEGKYSSHNNNGTTQTNQGPYQGSDHPSDSELREQSVRIMQRRKAERLARQAAVRDGGLFPDEGNP